MSTQQFLNFITVAQQQALHTATTKLYTLQTARNVVINSEELFWQAVRKTFPLNPPIGKALTSPIGALADSLFGGLLQADEPMVDVLWPFADSIRRPFLQDKVEFFRGVAFSMDPNDAHRIKYDEGGVTLRLFLLCANDNSRQQLETALTPFIQP